jgi:hypothetical protein
MSLCGNTETHFTGILETLGTFSEEIWRCQKWIPWFKSINVALNHPLRLPMCRTGLVFAIFVGTLEVLVISEKIVASHFAHVNCTTTVSYVWVILRVYYCTRVLLLLSTGVLMMDCNHVLNHTRPYKCWSNCSRHSIT